MLWRAKSLETRTASQRVYRVLRVAPPAKPGACVPAAACVALQKEGYALLRQATTWRVACLVGSAHRFRSSCACGHA